MSKIMLVNVTHVEESRVAVVNDGVLETYEIETFSRTNLRGNIHNAVVESVHANLEAAFVRIGSDLKGFLPLDGVNFRLLPSRGDSRRNGKIGQHLHPGQKLMVQVAREPFSGKPASVTTYFSLPGRFLVLMPGVDSAGVSRKIDENSQRDRLRKIVEELRPPEGFGLIVRTAGVGQTKTELQRDLRYLLRLWESIQRGSGATDFPGLVYREADLVIRTIRDHFTPDIQEVWIDSEEVHEKALEFVRDVMPTKAKTLRLYTGERPLFNKFNLEEQIEHIYKRRVPLPAGGEIVIDGTEALTAIDVNSARSRRQSDAEDTALQTNLEAAAELARQLRLRDLGGLIVVDFIDMHSKRSQSKIEKAMRDALKGDKARSDVTRLSKLGLLEIARQRLKGEKMAASYATCEVCDGHGLVKNVESAALAALRKLQTRTARGDLARVTLRLPQEVADWVQNYKRDELTRMEQRHGLRLEIHGDPKLRRHESAIETTARPRGEPSTAEPEPAPAPPPPPEIVSEPETRRARTSRPRKTRSRPDPDPRAEVQAEAEPESEPEKGPDAGATPETSPALTADRPDESAGAETAEARGRRRRRRRRRPRPAGTGNGGNPTSDAQPRSEDSAQPRAAPVEADEQVPRSVRSDELMPAAAGGRSRRRSGKAAGESADKSPRRGRGGRAPRRSRGSGGGTGGASGGKGS